MHKIIKIISKILFITLVGILIYQVATKTFEEQKITKSKEVKTYEVSQEDIISSGQEIIIKSFDAIESMKWVNNQQLMIVGEIDGRVSDFVFDTSTNELMINHSKTESENDFGDFEFIKEIPEMGSLCSRGTTLGLLKDGDYTIIADDATYNGQLKYKLSEDLTKLLYYQNEKNAIVTYAFERDFYRSINTNIAPEMMNDFNNLFQISPIGGYVSVEFRSDVLEESYFSIYGADSGKLYADQVLGTYLSWSASDEYVCFYYTNESTMLENSGINGIEITSKRIGYYDVDQKEIKYIDSSQTEKNTLSEIYWNENTITVLMGSIGDMITIESILSYDFNQGLFQELEVDLTPLESGTLLELLNYDDAYILLSQSKMNHQVIRILKNNEVFVYENLLPFDLIDQEDSYFYSEAGKFITVDYEKMTIASGDSEGYITLTDSAFLTLPNDDMTHVVVWLKNRSEIKILETN